MVLQARVARIEMEGGSLRTASAVATQQLRPMAADWPYKSTYSTPVTVPTRRSGPTIGVIGLGVMGEPIARNLLAAGFELAVFNRSYAKAERFRDDAVVTGSARDVFQVSDAVILIVPGEHEIDDVLERSGGVVRAPVKDRIVINMATVAPDYSERLAADVAAAGGRYVEAPVSGSRRPAEARQLVILAAAADDAVVDEVQPLFSAIGKITLRCGTPPSAMRMKLANNLLLITLMAGFTEAVHFARGIGVDLERFADMVLAGPMANDLFRGKARKLLDRDFAPEAAIKHVHKDIRLICAEAGRVGIHAPIASTQASLFAAAVEIGLAEDDAVGVLNVLEDRSVVS